MIKNIDFSAQSTSHYFDTRFKAIRRCHRY